MGSPATKPATYADTSFLFSLTLHDTNTAAAVACLKAHPVPLAFTDWQACELRNAVRLAAFRGNCSAAAATAALAKIEADVTAGNLRPTPLVWPDMLARAETISAAHGMTSGVRTLDLLHIAAALTLGAKTFLTCDDRQRAIARAVGLQADGI